MNINSSSPNPPQLLLEVSHTKAQLKAESSLFKLGEQLTARVSHHNSNTQQYTLKSNNLQLQVKSPIPLELGQKIQLEVSKTTPNLQLRIITADPAQQSVQQALRTLVARQAPLDETLTSLLKHNNASSTLPEPLTKLVKQLVTSLPDTHSLRSAEGIKLALRDSGMFLEQKLAKSVLSGVMNNQSLNNDMKAQLLRLVLLFKEYSSSTTKSGQASAPPLNDQGTRISHPVMLLEALFKKLNKNTTQSNTSKINAETIDPQQLSLLKDLGGKSEAALARQQLNQLNNLPTPDEPKPSWSFELPINTGKEVALLKLRIHQEEQVQEQNLEQAWHVTLNFHLPELGPLKASLRLQGKSLTTHLWSEQPELFEQHMDRLRSSLSKQGLEVGEINCHRGLPKQSEPSTAYSPKGLLDIEV